MYDIIIKNHSWWKIIEIWFRLDDNQIKEKDRAERSLRHNINKILKDIEQHNKQEEDK